MIAKWLILAGLAVLVGCEIAFAIWDYKNHDRRNK